MNCDNENTKIEGTCATITDVNDLKCALRIKAVSQIPPIFKVNQK
jgi:hypothetical protein